MPAARYCFPVDTLEQIERRVGMVKASKYINHLSRFLNLKLSKCEFDRLCIATIGRDIIPLHNHFIRSILKRACTSKTAPPRKSTVDSSWSVKTPKGSNNLQSLCKDFLQSPRKGRTPNLRESRFRDRPSPLVPHGKSNSNEDLVPKISENACVRPPLSVEDGEEVDQDFEILIDRSPITAPLGIPTYNKIAGILSKGLISSTAADIGQLPDTPSLTKRLEQDLKKEGLDMSVEAGNLLNNALDVYLKRLIKPCLDLAASRCVNKFSCQIHPGLNLQPRRRGLKKPIGGASASISDFQTAVKLNPTILGEKWPLHLEKVCFGALEDEFD